MCAVNKYRCNNDVTQYMPITLCKVITMNNIFPDEGSYIEHSAECMMEENMYALRQFYMYAVLWFITMAEQPLGKYFKQTLYDVGSR